MSIIIFDEKSVLDSKNKFDNYSNSILNAIKSIDKELKDMPRVLNTPKTKKAYVEIFDYFNEQIKFVDNNNKLFDKRFNTVVEEYTDFDQNVKKMVGGNK